MDIDHPSASDLKVSEERMQYPLFRRGFTAWRRADLPKRLVDFTEAQLPIDSVLHVADKLFMQESGSIAIDVSNPFIMNEDFIVYARHVTDIPDKDDPDFAPIGNYIHNPMKMKSRIMKFDQTSRVTRRMTSVKAQLNKKNVLSVFNYNPILYTYMTGRMVPYRKFDLLLKTMLHQIVQLMEDYPDKHHFIQIPVSPDPIKRDQFLMAFKKITQATLRVANDPSYYYMLHLLGLVTPDAVTSLFKKLTPLQRDHINVILTCPGAPEGIIYNLGDLEIMLPNKTDNMMLIRHINVMKMTASGVINEIKADQKNVDTSGDESDDIDEDKVDRIADTLSKSEDIEDEEIPEGTPEPDLPSENDPIDHDPYSLSDTSRIDEKALIPEEDVSISETIPSPSHQQHINDSLHEILDDATNPLTTRQREVILDTEKRYASIDLNGQSIASYLNSEPDTDPSVELDFLKDSLPDSSMAKSSVMDFDKKYVSESYDRDIAHVLTSFSAVGMILQDIKEEDEITEFDKVRHYTITFKDPKGKRHTCRFRLPIIEEDGTIKVNGVDYRMIKQQVNLPICKVSPSRVNLSSNFNKTLVERTQRAAYTFKDSINRYIGTLKKAGLVSLEYGSQSTLDKVPYDYATLMGHYSKLTMGDYKFTFDYENRLTLFSKEIGVEAIDQRILLEKARSGPEKKYGIFCGIKDNLSLYYGKDNVIRALRYKSKDDSDEVAEMFTFRELLGSLYGDQIQLPKAPAEWVEVKLQDKSWPVVFFLGYRFGLSSVLKEIKHPYVFYPKGKRAITRTDDIAIPFKDGKLVFPRYPLTGSLVLSGLNRFDTRSWNLDDFDIPDTYFTMLQSGGSSTNVLKGISSFFDLFVDPITRDVLIQMGEPTTVKGLLYRATEMLATLEAKPASSMENFRTRGYERFPYLLYNTLSREFARYQANRDPNKSFSINPEAVFLSIIQDTTLQPVDGINPIHDIKTVTQTTYGGQGGRSQQSFVVSDRQYPKDGVGVLSEAVPDSGKVAFNAYMPADPRMVNTRGMYSPPKDVKDMEPANILSVPALLMPGGAQDDGKRLAFCSIQLSHHVPSQEGETLRVRTGMESVVAHHGSEHFACAAKRDGVVVDINEKLGLLKLEYKLDPIKSGKDISISAKKDDVKKAFEKDQDLYTVMPQKDADKHPLGSAVSINGIDVFYVLEKIPFQSIDDVPDTSMLTQKDLRELSGKAVVYMRLRAAKHSDYDRFEVFSFGESFTSVSGTYLKQTNVLNVSLGEKFKRGDILVYNSGFFEKDPDSKQVNWKHGLTAKVVLIEKSETIEDSCEISSEFADKLDMSPAHLRVITTSKNTALSQVVEVGSSVETTDTLLIMEDGDLSGMDLDQDDETTDFLASILSRDAPTAKYHGTISEIKVFHACPFEELHESIQSLYKKSSALQVKKSKEVKGTSKESKFLAPQRIPVGTKYQGVDFEEDTVVITFMIDETLSCGPGDKLVLGAQAKTVVGAIMPNQATTESGDNIDIFFGATAINDRILYSPFVMGIGEQVMHALEKDVLEMYFDEK